MVMPLVTWVYYLDGSMQGNPRESTTVLDSEFNAMDSWFQVLDSSFCQWNLDSGFQLLVGCWTPCSVFRNPKPRIPDSTRQKFHGFRNPDSPFPWAVHRGDVKVLIRSCHYLPAEESYDEARRLLRRKYGSLWRRFPHRNNNELYLHDHTSTYSIAKAIFRNQNYNTGQLRYFDNNLSRTSKQAEIYFMNCILIK